jgi:hypothetical protein
MRHLRLIVVAILAALPAGYVAILATGVWRSGLTWREMDLDRNGTTSLDELFFVADNGRRDVIVDGRHCTEIFLLKDGQRLKLLCPDVA